MRKMTDDVDTDSQECERYYTSCNKDRCAACWDHAGTDFLADAGSKCWRTITPLQTTSEPMLGVPWRT